MRLKNWLIRSYSMADTPLPKGDPSLNCVILVLWRTEKMNMIWHDQIETDSHASASRQHATSVSCIALFASFGRRFRLQTLRKTIVGWPRKTQTPSAGCSRPMCSRIEVISSARQSLALPFAQTFPAKNGLCAFSSPTVVIGPCPGQMIVSSGSVRIFSRLFCSASS